MVHFDETGINIGKKRRWLHCTASEKWAAFYLHEKRGTEAMGEMGVLPLFQGIAVHDHWKPYYKYDCTHALCNAHHLRELTFAYEQDKQSWAKAMKTLLTDINKVVDEHGGSLKTSQAQDFRKQYRDILAEAEKECPAPVRAPGDKRRGRLKRTKSRNLLERLLSYECDVLYGKARSTFHQQPR